jgi:type IV pilus assembly protein PilW
MSAHKQQGFTLVELMISMVISLMVGLAALSSMKFFMALQRQSTGINAASLNTTTAFASLKMEASQAGLGFFYKGKFACTSFNVSQGNTTVLGNAPALPVSITVVNKIPKLTLTYATALESAASSVLFAGTTNNAGAAQITTFLPVGAGQSVLLVPSALNTPCSLKTVTEVVDSTGSGQKLVFDTAGANNAVAFTDVSYATGDGVLLTGSLQQTTFTVDAKNQLVMTRPMDGTSAVIAKDIVAIGMQYGISEVGRNAIAGWRYPLPYPSLGTGAEDWSAPTAAQIGSQVKAVRISVLTRSQQKDKAVDGKCATTESMPSLLGVVLGHVADSSLGLDSGQVLTPALSGDWQCYRYSESTVTLPLRNLVLGTQT